MKLAIITVTEKGVEKAFFIKEKIECDIFTISKFMREGTFLIENGLQNFFERIISKYNTFLFITATGIAVRTIAPFIKSKDKDPAILTMDEEGNFIISLLSGHLGGANEATKILSEITKSIPVISTASDVSGKIAVDTIAMKINGKLESLETAKKVTSLIVAGKEVNLKVPSNMENENPDGVIIISNRKNIEISKIIPQNIVVGIGCRKGKEKEKIIDAVKESLDKLNICEESIRLFSTVDVKKDEIGIIETAKFFDRELRIISCDEIKKIEDRFEKSEFVKKNIGVSSVSAPSAFIASGRNGKFLVEKLKYDGITISIFEEETKRDEKR
ncbi:cobalt-precorrin 5A hydrolase [Fusobacterium sp.]|uniref:cobalt-precorrin 5A hydrolase n=1 Tax=Fusobacterium sp. TaxID=68766 RepID=UPI00260D8F98|nr:cobalt-precorrin 5A hydrolase [Fusobacterium sp.]